MPKFIFPDGSSVHIPEGVDPEVATRNIIKQFAGKHGLPEDAGEKVGLTGDLKAAALSGLSSVFAGLPGVIRAGIGGDWNNPQLQKYRYQTEVLAPSFQRASTQKMQEEATKAIEKAEEEGGISSGALEAIKQYSGRLGILSAVQSLPSMLAGAGIGGLAGRGITAAIPSLVGRKAAISAAGAVGSEAVMEGAEAAGETYKTVYEDAIKKGLSPEEANRIADSAAKKSAAASAGVTATLGALPIPTAEKLLAGRLAGKVPGGRLTTAGLGAAGEIPTEMAQAATSSIGVQRGLQELLPEEERTTEQLLKGVGGAMGQAAVGAGLIGGGAGFISGGRRPEAPPSPAVETPVTPAAGGAVTPPTPPAPAAETPVTPPAAAPAGPAVPPPPAVVMTPQERQAQKAAYKEQIAQLETLGLPPETIAQIKTEIGGKLNNKTPSIANLEAVGEILKKYQPEGGTNVPGTPANVPTGVGVGVGVAGGPTGGTTTGGAGAPPTGSLGGTNVPPVPPQGGAGAGQPSLTVEPGEEPVAPDEAAEARRLFEKFTVAKQQLPVLEEDYRQKLEAFQEEVAKAKNQAELDPIEERMREERNNYQAQKQIFEDDIAAYRDKFQEAMGVVKQPQSPALETRKNNEAAQAVAAADYPGLINALKKSPNRLTRWIANKATNIEGITINPKPIASFSRVAGSFSYDPNLRVPQSRVLRFNKSFRDDEHVLTHEVAHAVTSEILRNPNPSQKPVVKSLEKLFDTLKRRGDITGDYADKNVRELVAEGMSNPEFQLKLMRIPYKNTTAWGKFTQLVGNLLGIRPEDQTAFTELINLTDQLAQEKVKEEKQGYGVSPLLLPRATKVAKDETAQAEKKENLDPEDSEAREVQNGIEGKNIIGAANWMATNHPNAEGRLIAKAVTKQIERLQDSGLKFNFSVIHVGDKTYAPASRGVVHANYANGFFDVEVKGADVTGYVGTSYETVLHELVHAATMAATRFGNTRAAGNTQLSKDVADLYSVSRAIIAHFNERASKGESGLTDFEKAIFKRNKNALANPDEILAWAFTNKEMQDYLETIPYKGGSLWSGFVEAIRQFLNLPAKADTALSEVLRVGENLFTADVTSIKDVAGKVGINYAIDSNRAVAVDTTPAPKRLTDKFKRWFGDSKVVDAEGKPLVLYRGVRGDAEGALNAEPRDGYNVFASSSPDVAATYGMPDAEFGIPGSIVPIYVKADKLIEFPVTKDKYGNNKFDKVEFDRRAQTLRSGEVLVARQVIDIGPMSSEAYAVDRDKKYTYPSDVYALGKGTSVKSAIGNNGEYDISKPSIDEVTAPKKPRTPAQQAAAQKMREAGEARRAAKKAAKEAEAQRKAANLVSPSLNKIDQIRRKFQNVQIALYNISDAVKEKLGGILPSWLDLASALSLGKGEQAANFERYAGNLERRYTTVLETLTKQMDVKVGEAARQIGNYMLARHELERRSAIFYEKRATLTDENEANRTFLLSAIVANDKELAKLKKDFKADIKTAEQQRIYDLVDQSQNRAMDLYQEVINIVNNDPVARTLDFNATTYDVVAYENDKGEEVKMTPQDRDRIIAEMEAKFSNAEIRKAVEEAIEVQKKLDKAIQEMNKLGNYTSKGAARLMEARNWQSYVPQRGVKKEDSDFEYYGETGSSGLGQSETATGGRASAADNVVTRTIVEAKKAAGRAPGNRLATIIRNYVAEGYIQGKISKSPLTTLDNYILGKNTNRGDDIVLYRDDDGEIYEIKIDSETIANAIQAKTHELIPVAKPLAATTMLMAQSNTRFNPMFWLKNFFVDPLTNTFIIGSEKGLKAAAQYATTVVSDLLDSRGTSKSMNFIRLYNKGELDQISELAAKDAWYRDALEYVNIGGRISYLSGLRNETQAEQMYKKLGPGKIIRTAEQLAAFTDVANEGLELALRVSAFRSAKSFPEFEGDVRKAAAYAKDLANFEQMGQWGKWMGAWFMFSRPSATGASRLYDALSKGKYAKEAVATAAIFGTGIYFLSMLMSGDDDEGRNRTEYDDPARWVRNWRLFIPGFESPIQVPWGFGLGSFAAASAQLSMFLFGKSDAKEFAGNMKTIASEALGLPISQMSFLENPAAFILDSITPAPAKPLLQMVADTDSLGRAVFHKGQTKYANAYMGGENIPESVKAMGETMFDVFKEVLPESVMKVLSPDGLHFLGNSYLGGLYRTMSQMDRNLRATGVFNENEQKDLNAIKSTILLAPFVGTAANYDLRQYGETRKEIEQYKKVLRTYKDQAPEKYAQYKEDHPGRERAVKYFESQENSALRDLREQANAIKRRYREAPKDREEALKENRERQNAVMRRMVERTQELLED